MLGSVSEHQSHSKATTPLFRFAHLVEIEESATGHAILQNHFSPVLMRQDLCAADSSYLPWNEAYEHSLTLSSHLFLVPCYEVEPNELHFFADIFIKR